MGLKKNIVYSMILTVSNLLFPLITYPYVSRILGVNNIGICNFVDSIVQYFILFSMLGISYVGIREIAYAWKKERESVESVFCSLFTINTVSTLVVLFFYIALIFFIPSLNEYKSLMFIGLIKIIGNFLMVDWFYKGIEEFKYITNRSILVKVSYVIGVFVFVKTEDDYGLFFLMSSLMIGVNAIFNILYLKKFISFSTNKISIRKYLKPIFVMGLYSILTSTYTTLNVTYLGFATNTIQVGYYTTANKLFTLIISFYTAFTGVMLPRMSSILSAGDVNSFIAYVKKSVIFLFSVSMPIIIICLMFSTELIHMLAGKGYDGAITPFMIIMPMIMILGYNQIQVIQILSPLRKDNVILNNSAVACIVGILCNILLVGRLGAIGASITLVLSEMSILFLSMRYISNEIEFFFPWKSLLLRILEYLPCVIILSMLKKVELSSYILLCVSSVLVIFYFAIVEIAVNKTEIFINVQKQISSLLGYKR